MIASITDKSLNEIVKEAQSVIGIIDALHEQGYEYNFELIGRRLMCVENHIHYHHIQFHVDEIYRIDGGIMQPHGFSIFALRHRSERLKGIFIAV